MTITLSSGQQDALDKFQQFILDPEQQVFVLKGYSGCGKSFLVATLIDAFPRFLRAAKLINPDMIDYEVALTATTNKAAENLRHLSGGEVNTIHSFLELRVNTDFKTGVTTLIPRNDNVQEGFLLFIDEASFIDSALLQMIFERTRNCKIVFIGDPAQLVPVKSNSTPVFDADFPEAMLDQVMRQAEGNPIIEMATQFRHVVNGMPWDQFTAKPDGHHIVHLDRDAFNAAVLAEFTRPDWRYQDSKVLAWTNKRVIEYNHFVREHAKGDPHFQVEDYAVCNSFCTKDKTSLKTDQLVQITRISGDTERYGVSGKYYQVDGRTEFFMPSSLELRKAAEKAAKAREDSRALYEIGQEWIDLRAAYACTINKSQGSTFDAVFIDLDDIARCHQGNAIARMLYVGVSRARHHVYLTGDLA